MLKLGGCVLGELLGERRIVRSGNPGLPCCIGRQIG